MPGQMHPALRLYLLCKATKWAHLPLAGGWFDQRPSLVDHFTVIMAAEAQVQKKKAADREKKSKAKGGGLNRYRS